MITVFISQPFKNRTEEDIFRQREEMINKFAKIYKTIMKEEPELDVFDQYDQEVPEDGGRFYSLGNDIQLMGKADFILFTPDWRKSKRCQMEHTLCDIYNLSFIEL